MPRLFSFTEIERDHIAVALKYAIEQREQQEKNWGYTLPSAQLAAWRDLFARLQPAIR